MVRDAFAQYGGSASSVNADVAKAYSVGQVIAQAVTATGGTQQREDHQLPARRRCPLNTVQGLVKFDALGENGGRGGIHLPVAGRLLQPGPPAGTTGSVSILATKPPWTS